MAIVPVVEVEAHVKLPKQGEDQPTDLHCFRPRQTHPRLLPILAFFSASPFRRLCVVETGLRR